MSVDISSLAARLPPSPSSSFGNRRAFLPPPGLDLPKPPPFSSNPVRFGSGLQTPPVDDMSTTYQATPANYEGHGVHGYPQSSLSIPNGRPLDTSHDPRSAQYYDMSEQQDQRHYQQFHPHYQPASATAQSMSVTGMAQKHLASQSSARPPTPSPPVPMAMSAEMSTSKRDAETLVYHSLQIPKCISPNGGNLADFAAQMTCLFWFQSGDELKQAESIRSRSPMAPLPRLSTLATPYDQFRKWVYSVLSTTQVTQNVVLLALLFIYRLKLSTPQIRGRGGSEYRLLTVALMLGNKFLDDNTYTNKTWAEVSCFAVQEIHVMEVEFLSNMRYNLVASKEEWEDWLVKLACFHEYYEQARRVPVSPVHAESPSNKGLSTPPHHGQQAGNPDVMSLPSNAALQSWPAHQANAVSPLAMKPLVHLPAMTRKRGSPEDDYLEHPAKRIAPPRLNHIGEQNFGPRPNAVTESSRRPAPHLTVITNPPTNPPANYANAAPFVPSNYPAAPNMISLPPLQTGVRAMATVYPQQGPLQVQQQPMATPTSLQSNMVTTPTAQVHPPVTFATPTKHQNPGLMTYSSSPVADLLAPVSAVHTPINNSPIAYLQQRTSPYRPIRHVNTLLYPPPSASLEQYHLAVPLPPNQMHYQPLGRRHDLRTGVVPDFVLFNRGHHAPYQGQSTMDSQFAA